MCESGKAHGVVFRECRFISDVPHAAFNRPYSTAAPAELPSLPFGRGPFIRRWRTAHQSLRIWDTRAPDPSALWRLVETPDSYGFSRRKRIANALAATAPDPHMDSRGHAPLCGLGRVEYSPILGKCQPSS